MVAKMLSSYPDYAKAPPEYLLTLTEIIAMQSNFMQLRICNPVNGVASKTKFLPTAADVMEFVKAEEKARTQFESPTTYQRFSPAVEARLPEYETERRKRIVAETLGRDPQRARRADLPTFETIPIDKFKSSDDLKTRSRPISDDLKRFIIDGGNGYLLQQEQPQ